MAEEKSSRRTFLKQLGALTAGAALLPAANTLGQLARKPTETVLFLSNGKGERLPIDMDITVMPQIPKGWEWAKEPLTQMVEGFKKIRENERKIVGSNNVLERYIRDGGVFALSEDGKIFGQEVPGDSTYSRLPTAKGNYPIIILNADPLKKAPKNAAFYEGHELGHHFNYPSGLFEQYSAEQVAQAGGGALVHSSHPLFGIAVNMDYADLKRQGRENESLLTFTQYRVSDPTSYEMTNQVEREKEFFADAFATSLSGVHPDFRWNELFAKNQKPLNSPLVKRYIENVALYDIALRNTPTPANRQKIKDLYELLTDPKRIFGDEATFRYVGAQDDKFAQTQAIAPADLDKCKAILNKSLDGFEKQRNELLGRPQQR